jgi:hypothetical protein
MGERYFDSTSNKLTLPVTRHDIADYLGTSAESVTRALAGASGPATHHLPWPVFSGSGADSCAEDA